MAALLRGLCVATVLLLVGAARAGAAAPLGLTDCAPAQGVEECSGLVTTWDGVPLDTTVVLPAAGAEHLPLVVEIHGFGNSKYEYLNPADSAYTDNAYAWARAGYAVLTYTARGLWGSCGTPESRAADPTACARGYIHLGDLRYEVRDTQELVGRLVDEGVADGARIGVTGDSYGGGQSFMLAALRDRVMLPDGTLVPWRSPAGTPLEIAAAAPVIPWTDLIYAIAPNGRTPAESVSPPGAETSPLGVFKASFANGIAAAAQFATGPGQPVGEPFVPGRPMGYLAPAGSDPDADVEGWVARADRGEPYDDPGLHDIVDRLERFHSAYHVPDDRPPAPLFVGSGFTDDLFPVDETLRYVNRLQAEHPDAPVALLFGDFGHQRAGNKPGDRALLLRSVHAWMDHYLRGSGTPPSGVTAMTQTCPRTVPSGGPFHATTFDALAHGAVEYSSHKPQTIESGGGDPSIGAAIDPVAGGGDACATTPAATQNGTATYLLPAAPKAGYTLMGAPAVTAQMTLAGDPAVAQVAARLWDVAPGGGPQTLVARGLYRPAGHGAERFELHANGWRFAAGHVPKLELLGSDAPYARPSNGSFSVEVGRLDLRLPVRERTQSPRLRLVLRCTRRGTRATAAVSGARARRIDDCVRGRRVARDSRPPFRRTVLPRGRGGRVSAVAAIAGAPSVRAARSAARCGRA